MSFTATIPNSKLIYCDQGTHTYPISFALPSNLPPTVHLLSGSVSYYLSATIHRPGAFKPRLTTSVEVTLISSPPSSLHSHHTYDAEEGEAGISPSGREGGNITVERQWEDELRYIIEVEGRRVVVGGELPVRVTLMPLGKVRVWRISAYLEGRPLPHLPLVALLTLLGRRTSGISFTIQTCCLTREYPSFRTLVRPLTNFQWQRQRDASTSHILHFPFCPPRQPSVPLHSPTTRRPRSLIRTAQSRTVGSQRDVEVPR